MSRAIIGIQSRLTSTRFPGKTFEEIAPGVTVAKAVIDGCALSGLPVWLLVPDTPDNQPLADWFLDGRYGDQIRTGEKGLFLGDEDDVLGRYAVWVSGQDLTEQDYIVRITGDCPLVDGRIIRHMVNIAISLKLDYVSNVLERTFPIGLDVEVIRVGTLRFLDRTVRDLRLREHVTLALRESVDTENHAWSNEYRCANYYNLGEQYPNEPELRWCVDYPKDLEVVKALWAATHPEVERRNDGHASTT